MLLKLWRFSSVRLAKGPVPPTPPLQCLFWALSTDECFVDARDFGLDLTAAARFKFRSLLVEGLRRCKS